MIPVMTDTLKNKEEVNVRQVSTIII